MCNGGKFPSPPAQGGPTVEVEAAEEWPHDRPGRRQCKPVWMQPLRWLFAKEPEFTMDDIRQHRSADDCWVVAHGKVYDATPYISSHPGGVGAILNRAGCMDASRDYDFHLKAGREMWARHYIGRVKR
mmetsp:Transcript_97811/g.276691  ORF Transcript_97811/g.276691 Transcript_97811/m.276691 type:complete len:128 (-) Transcript_97811:221-604(-)